MQPRSIPPLPSLSHKLTHQQQPYQRLKIYLADSPPPIPDKHRQKNSLQTGAIDPYRLRTITRAEQGDEKAEQTQNTVRCLPLNSTQKLAAELPKPLKSNLSTQPTGYKRLQSLNDSYLQGPDTSRSNQEISLRNDSSVFIPNLREQEMMLKQIEEKAMQLKRKEKKEREILKQLRKGNEGRGSEGELEMKESGQTKPKKGHRRVMSELSDSGEEEILAKLSDLQLKYVESQQQGERLAPYRLKCAELEAQLVKLQQQLCSSQEERVKIQEKHKSIIQIQGQQEEEKLKLREELERVSSSLEEQKQENKNIIEKYKREKEGLEKQRDQMVVNLDQTQTIKSKHNQTVGKLQAKVHQLKQELTRKTAEIAKLTHQNEERQKTNRQLQQFLINAQEHIRKVESKFHQLSKDMTEKNLAYDFLWMQLHEQKQNDDKMHSNRHLRSVSGNIETPETQTEQKDHREMKRNLSATTIKQLEEDIRDIKLLIEGREKQERERDEPTNLPVTLLPQCQSSSHSLSNSLLDKRSPAKLDLSAHNSESSEELLQLPTRSHPPLLLQQSISDVLSSSERNDEINDMQSKHSNASKMESSLGAFSEYSRAVSTQSDAPHSEVEQDYRQKMRSRKLMAKLGRLKR